MKESEIIAIPKKVRATECSKHRTISILSKVARRILKVIDERLKRKVMEYVDEDKEGFRRRKGTRYATFVLRTIMEMVIEKQKDLYFFLLTSKRLLKR